MGISNTIQYIWNHPLSNGRRISRLAGFLKWQIGSRLVPGPVLAPFVNDILLTVQRGQHGATGCVYTGLHEFDEMAFVLHALRPQDLFMDIGANIGTYTLLAAGAVGCSCISVEPIEKTHRHLTQNIHINRLEARASTYRVAIGSHCGTVMMTTNNDTTNRVVYENNSIHTATVEMTTIDLLSKERTPTIIKMDVEGFETEAIAGAERVLRDETLLAVIMETTDKTIRIGGTAKKLYNTMRDYGFTPYHYNGIRRSLTQCNVNGAEHNSIFIRDLVNIQQRCTTSPRYNVQNRQV